METNSPRTWNVELHRAGTRPTALGTVAAESIHCSSGAGHCGRPPGAFPLRPAPEPDLPSEMSAAELPSHVAVGEAASVLTLYFREIRQVKLLSPEEEAALAGRVREGDAEAREAMIKANLRLVVRIAHNFEGMGLALLDLISEGNIGLMVAVDRFDVTQGVRFSAYASFWIKHCMRRALSNHARTIRVPVSAQDKLHTVQSARVRLLKLLGRDPTNDEIAQEAGLPAAEVQRVREAMQTTVSLDESLDGQEGRSAAETVADEHSADPYETLAHAATLQNLEGFFGELDSREQTILRSRFGLEGKEETTIDQIGRQLGLSGERVRQIHNGALAKLRKKLESQELEILVN